ncbi:MAG: hypothetical protein ACXWWY_10810 [Candidatus Deferrimicrobiaceae bacterium]
MKSLLSPVAVYVAALVLFSMTPISADTARGAGDGPVPQGTALPRSLLDGKTFVAQAWDVAEVLRALHLTRPAGGS